MSDDPTDQLIGIRGPGNPSPRWAPVHDLFAEMRRAHLEHGPLASAPISQRIHDATVVDDVDAEGLDIRARALSNLAAVADHEGRLEDSLRIAQDCIDTCLQVSARIGNERRTDDVRTGTLVNRAQTRYVLGDFTGALADLDEAAAAAPDEGQAALLLAFQVHNNRTAVLVGLDRWDEARASAERALEIALGGEPRLVAHAYLGLALVAHRTGDRAGGREQMRLARELFGDDVASAASTEENLARMCLDLGELDQAEAHFSAAEEGYAKAGIPRSVAGCRFGRAAALMRRNKLLPARKMAREALNDFQDTGDVPAQIETSLLLGDIHAVSMQFARGDEFYLMARALCAEADSPHERARIDVRRAALAQAAAKVALRPKEKRRRLEAALNLALPAALATDALRHRFAAGPVRERWVTDVAGQALGITLDLIVSLQETRLAAELAELMAASVSLEVATELHPVPVPSGTARAPFPAELAVAAGGGVPEASSDSPSIAALPPRVRFLPGGDLALGAWIDEAQARYGIPIRSEEVVDAW